MVNIPFRNNTYHPHQVNKPIYQYLNKVVALNINKIAMTFIKGQSGNPDGRPAKKKPIKVRTEALLQDTLDQVSQEIKTATPEERRSFFISLISAVLPQRQIAD